jgi:hypothetical protein
MRQPGWHRARWNSIARLSTSTIDSMRRSTITRDTETDARLELIKHLSQQVADAPTNSRQHQRLKAAIRAEAGAYRKSLDTEQATATHDPKPQSAIGRGSLIARRTVGA